MGSWRRKARAAEGGNILVLLFCFVVAAGHSGADHPAPPSAQRGDDAGVSAHVTWRMESTAHVASLAIRTMYCKLEPERVCEIPMYTKLKSLQLWASNNPAWGRLLASLSNYELGRRFWQQQDYMRSLEVVEWSIAHKLFPYEDQELQAHWQRNLMGTSHTFKRPKLELADGLILMANCMFEIGRRQSSVEHLYLSLEAIHLSAVMMHNSMDLVQEVLSHLDLLSQHVAIALTHALVHLQPDKLMELMVIYGAQCQSCGERRDFVEALLVRLSLPVRFGADGVALEVVAPTFVHDAYVHQPGEAAEQFSRRLMQQMVGMIRLGLLSDLNVSCRKWSDEQDCDTEHLWQEGLRLDNKSSGWLHSIHGSSEQEVGGAGCRGSRAGVGQDGAAAAASPSLVDSLFSGVMHEDIRQLMRTMELTAAGAGAGAGAGTAGGEQQQQQQQQQRSPGAAGGEAGTQDLADMGHLADWQVAPPFPPPPAMMLGAAAQTLGPVPPLPFRPPKPAATRPPTFRKLLNPAAVLKQLRGGPPGSGGVGAGEPQAPAPWEQEQRIDLGIAHVDVAADGSLRLQPGPWCCDERTGVLACCAIFNSVGVAGGSGSGGGGAEGGGGSGGGEGGGRAVSSAMGGALGWWAALLRPAALEQQQDKGASMQPEQDEPTLFVLLSGLSAAALVSCTLLKNRNRLSRLLSPSARAWVRAAGCRGSSPGTRAGGVGDMALLVAQRRRVAAAALKEALRESTAAGAVAGSGARARGAGAGGASRLEAALSAAEAAGLQDAALMQRAEAALALEQQQQQQQQQRRRSGSSSGAGTAAAASQSARQRGARARGAASAAGPPPLAASSQPSPVPDQAARPGAAGAAKHRAGSWLEAELSIRFLWPSVSQLLAYVSSWSLLHPADEDRETAPAAQDCGVAAPPCPAVCTAEDGARSVLPQHYASDRRMDAPPGAAPQPSKPASSLRVSRQRGDALDPAHRSTPHSDSDNSPECSSTGSAASPPHRPRHADPPDAMLEMSLLEAAADAWETPGETVKPAGEEPGWQEGRRKRGSTSTTPAPTSAKPAVLSKLDEQGLNQKDLQPGSSKSLLAQQRASSSSSSSTSCETAFVQGKPAPGLLPAMAAVAVALKPGAAPTAPATPPSASTPSTQRASGPPLPVPTHPAPPAATSPAVPAAKPARAAKQQGADAAILSRAKPVKTKLGAVKAGSASGTPRPAPSTASDTGSSKHSPAARAQHNAAAAAASPSPGQVGAKPPHRTSFASSLSFSPSHPTSSTSSLPSLSSISLSPSLHNSGPNARSSPEQAGPHAYPYPYLSPPPPPPPRVSTTTSPCPPPPPPPPPPPRASPLHNKPNPTPATASPAAASPRTATAPVALPSSASPLSAAQPPFSPDEPNPFSNPTVAKAVAYASSNVAAGSAFPSGRAGSNGFALPPGFLQQQQPASASPTSRLNLFRNLGAEPHIKALGTEIQGRPLGNGTNLQIGSFQSADYDGILHSQHCSGEHEQLGLGDRLQHFSHFSPLPMHVDGSSASPAFGQGAVGDVGLAALGSGAVPLPLLFTSSSVWSNSGSGAADNGGSWLQHSSSVPAAFASLAEARFRSVSAVAGGSGGGGGGGAVAPGVNSWLSHTTAAATSSPSTSSSGLSPHIWTSAAASLYNPHNTWPRGLPLSSMLSPPPAPLSHGLPQILSETDLVCLDLPFVPAMEPESPMGASPDLRTIEAPDWAHQIMRVVE